MNPSSEQPEATAHHQALVLLNSLCEFARCQISDPRAAGDLFTIVDLLIIPLYQAALCGYRNAGPQRDGFWLREKAYHARNWLQSQVESLTTTSASPVEVLFCPSNHTHVTAMLPVAKCLSTQAKYAFATNKPVLHAWLRAEQQKPTFVMLRDSNVISQYDEGTTCKPRCYIRTQVEEMLRKFFATVNLGERTAQLLIEAVSTHYWAASGAIDAAERLIRDFVPKVIVVGNDLSTEGRAICRVARASGIPTLVPAHGSILGESTHGMHIADILTVYGENHRNTLVGLGTPAEAVVIVGAPYLDHQCLEKRSIDRSLSNQCSVGNAPWVLVANSGPGHSISLHHHKLTIEHIYKVAQANERLHFVVKLHKKDHPRYYANCPAELRRRFHVIRHGTQGYPTSIFDWIAGASAVLTGASTVALEAMLMKVPVITMDFYNELAKVEFIRAGTTIHVTSLSELGEAVQRVPFVDGVPTQVQSNAAEYIHREFYRLDGQAANRTVQEILKLRDSWQVSTGSSRQSEGRSDSGEVSPSESVIR